MNISMKLYVGNLLFQAPSFDLEELFKQAGEVDSARVVTTPAGTLCGYGFVMMASREEGEPAIARFNEKEFNGSQLIVNEEKPSKAAAAGVGFGSSQSRKDNSYAASRAIRWPRP